METMTLATDKATRRVFHSAALPWLVLVIGIPAALFLFMFVRNSVEDVAQLRFEREANSANGVIEGRLRSYSDVLYAFRALFASEDQTDRLRFHRFVESLDVQHRYPGFLSLNYAVYVPARDKQRFEEAVRRDTSLDPRGYPQFAIKPSGDRPEYYVITYLEPMAGYEFAFGLDIGTNPMAANPKEVAVAVRLHRDSGNLSASAQPLRIMRAKVAIYLAMRLAVYRNGMPVSTVEQRRAAYIGSIGAGFDVESLMRAALSEEMLRYMLIRLYDAGFASDQRDSDSSGERRLLFDSAQLTKRSLTPSEKDASGSTFVHVLPVEIASRVWEFEYSAQKDSIISDTDRLLPPLVLAGGLLSSLLLFGVLYSLASSRSRAVEIANEITRDLRASTEQLQALSRRLVDIQETDRRQFSRELHDRIGQNLTALSINLDILKTQLSNNESAEFRSRLDDSAALLESTAGAVENVMSELRPPMLDDYGLLPALQWYGKQFSNRTGIRVEVHGDERMERQTPAVEIALFRIAQEALNNIAKHAHAGSVDVRLERSGGQFVMSVSDDGVGIDAASIADSTRRPGLGMVTMRERTQAIGGHFEIVAAPGGGTRVVARIPC
jgi:signal transduction histidine kinase